MGGCRERGTAECQSVPGYISLINLVYIATEIFEFAARICQAGVYRGNITITIELNGIKGYLLTTDFDRAWSQYCPASENHFGKTWQVSNEGLISASGRLLPECDCLARRAFWVGFAESYGVEERPTEVFVGAAIALDFEGPLRASA